MANLKDIRILAAQLMSQYQLQGWSFKYDKSVHRFGLCNSRTKVISLNPIMTAKNTVERVRETILHEIAHAIVGCQNGHNDIWAAQCIRMGIRPDQFYSIRDTSIASSRWKFPCPTCGRVFYRNRISKIGHYWCPNDKTILLPQKNEQYLKERSAALISRKYGIDPDETFDL